jgi:hypothetical protein
MVVEITGEGTLPTTRDLGSEMHLGQRSFERGTSSFLQGSSVNGSSLAHSDSQSSAPCAMTIRLYLFPSYIRPTRILASQRPRCPPSRGQMARRSTPATSTSWTRRLSPRKPEDSARRQIEQLTALSIQYDLFCLQTNNSKSQTPMKAREHLHRGSNLNFRPYQGTCLAPRIGPKLRFE